MAANITDMITAMTKAVEILGTQINNMNAGPMGEETVEAAQKQGKFAGGSTGLLINGKLASVMKRRYRTLAENPERMNSVREDLSTKDKK